MAWRSSKELRHSNHLNSIVVVINNDDVAFLINRNSNRIDLLILQIRTCRSSCHYETSLELDCCQYQQR